MEKDNIKKKQLEENKTKTWIVFVRQRMQVQEKTWDRRGYSKKKTTKLMRQGIQKILGGHCKNEKTRLSKRRDSRKTIQYM